jgi:WhiB family redox-sensing transcriptional regulator
MRHGAAGGQVVVAELSRLPGPVADLWDWQLEGSCRQVNPEVFFHPEGERGSARRTRDSAAKEVCLGCPVLAQCREHALRVREPYGVWGARTEDEREAHFAGRRVVPAAS